MMLVLSKATRDVRRRRGVLAWAVWFPWWMRFIFATAMLPFALLWEFAVDTREMIGTWAGLPKDFRYQDRSA